MTMMLKTLAFGIILATATSACAANAPKAREMFQRMDTNNDWQLQFSEVQAARGAVFDRLDTNRNRTLEADEVQAARDVLKDRPALEAGSADDLSARATLMDSNGDGHLTRDEFTAFIPARLLNADANGDRSLSLRELRGLRQR